MSYLFSKIKKLIKPLSDDIDSDSSEIGASSKAVKLVNDKITKASRNVGEIFYSVFPISDPGVHICDGSIIQNEDIHSNFINFIREKYQEHLTDSFGTYLFLTNDEYDNYMNIYGSCGGFVYDETNNTVRLPTLHSIIQPTTTFGTSGEIKEAGVPEIATSFYQSGSEIRHVVTGGPENIRTGYNRNNFNFRASDLNSVYGNSNTVQPQTVCYLPYIVLANTHPQEVSLNIDINSITSELNKKADIANISNYAMPDYSRYINTYLSDIIKDRKDNAHTYGSIIAPSDGYFTIYVDTTDSTFSDNNLSWIMTCMISSSSDFNVRVPTLIDYHMKYNTEFSFMFPISKNYFLNFCITEINHSYPVETYIQAILNRVVFYPCTGAIL